MEATLSTIDPASGEILPPSWDELCERGRLAQANMDDGRWTIGDLALTVESQYGQDKLADFAREVNVEKASAKQYRSVCKFYQKATRVSFLADHPNLTYTHLRDAMRLKDAEAAYQFLDDAADHTWTVEQARVKLAEKLGKPVPPPKILDAAGCRIVSATGSRQIIFEFSDEVARTLRALFFARQGERLTMTLVQA